MLAARALVDHLAEGRDLDIDTISLLQDCNYDYSGLVNIDEKNLKYRAKNNPHALVEALHQLFDNYS